jgi:lysyl-tRNA synthetase class II
MANAGNHTGDEEFKASYNKIKRGDIIGIIGKPGRTKTGELSVASA